MLSSPPPSPLSSPYILVSEAMCALAAGFQLPTNKHTNTSSDESSDESVIKSVRDTDTDGGTVGWYCTHSQPTVSVCHWSGVFCTGEAITGLSLNHNKLQGTIATALSYLTDLMYIDLSVNNLQGEIPQSLTCLDSLSYLYLNNNQLSGLIPSTIGLINSLQILQLDSNQFLGEIPDTIGLLTGLMYLSLSYNSFTNSLPSTLCWLESLQVFTIFNTQITCFPSCLMQLPIFRYNSDNSYNPDESSNSDININSDTSFNSDISVCTEFVNDINILMCNLVELNITNEWQGICESGEPVESVCSWSRVGCTGDIVTSLDLSGLQIQGTIPTILGAIYSLEQLNLGQNQFVGTVPSVLSNLIALSDLDMHDNSLEGRIPSEFGSLGMLSFLDLSTNLLTGVVPSELCTLKQLQTISTSNNQLTCYTSCLSTIPDTDFYILPCMSTINSDMCEVAASLTFTSKTVHGWMCSGGKPVLSFCSWAGVQCRGSVITHINLANMGLVGTISTALVELSALTTLDLHNNRFIGTIPTSFILLTALKRLDLSNNLLSGTVSHTVCNMKLLQQLYLSGNKLNCLSTCFSKIAISDTQHAICQNYPTVSPATAPTPTHVTTMAPVMTPAQVDFEKTSKENKILSIVLCVLFMYVLVGMYL